MLKLDTGVRTTVFLQASQNSGKRCVESKAVNSPSKHVNIACLILWDRGHTKSQSLRQGGGTSNYTRYFPPIELPCRPPSRGTLFLDRRCKGVVGRCRLKPPSMQPNYCHGAARPVPRRRRRLRRRLALALVRAEDRAAGSSSPSMRAPRFLVLDEAVGEAERPSSETAAQHSIVAGTGSSDFRFALGGSQMKPGPSDGGRPTSYVRLSLYAQRAVKFSLS